MVLYDPYDTSMQEEQFEINKTMLMFLRNSWVEFFQLYGAVLQSDCGAVSHIWSYHVTTCDHISAPGWLFCPKCGVFLEEVHPRNYTDFKITNEEVQLVWEKAHRKLMRQILNQPL